MRLECVQPLPFPDHLDIELTNACNLRCSMCPREKMTRPVGYMTKKTLEKVLAEAHGKVKTCYLHQMGEPLLHPDLKEFIVLVKEAHIWTSLSTNGVFLTEKIGQVLINSGLDHIAIAFDSLHSDTYSKMRVGADPSLVLENIERFLTMVRDQRAGPQVDIQMVVLGLNMGEVEDYVAFFTPRVVGIGRVILSPAVDWASTVDVVVDDKRDFACTMLNYSMTIQWNGDVCLCCRDFDGATKVGNVHESTLQELWDGPVYRTWRGGFPKFCRGCFT